uniref:Chromosome 2 open reading frame 42 n=1 Tax=Salmo trutta TaxID=8032 RepID=A0A674DHB0_SALTR
KTPNNYRGRLTAISTTPSFLSNLGKPTLRGIRKCPQCGVFNGTRGLSCKNKACGIVFRDGGAVGGGAQVFSVCQRVRGVGAAATQRGFIELVPTDTAIATSEGATLLTRVNMGRCFLPTCRHAAVLTNPPSKQGLSNSVTPCVHVKQAMECQVQATPLPLKSSILEGLQASAEAREELWRLATESPGPLVQRVNKDTLVVKCHSGPSHPLGLLHLTVGAGGSDGEVRGSSSGVLPDSNSRPGADAGPTAPYLCLHFYACVCAFTSDEKLASEFTGFINYSSNGRSLGEGLVFLCGSSPPQLPEPITAHKTKRLRLEEHLIGELPCQSHCSSNRSARSSQPVDESLVTLGFQQWLASVTERIHQTMHYQFDGKPEPLVFHVPHVFFNALQYRLSLGSKKRRLPNATSAFVRNDDLHHGSFPKYTWHITNLMQVKRIFDTPELPLELTQSFVKNSDGSYSPFRCPEPLPPDPTEGYSRTDRSQAIRPLELRTFLQVGVSDQKDPTPFVIEWIPDILPRCRVGELRIRFQYGHQHGGQTEYCDGTPSYPLSLPLQLTWISVNSRYYMTSMYQIAGA